MATVQSTGNGKKDVQEEKIKVYMGVAQSLFYLTLINEITLFFNLNSIPSKSSMLLYV